MNTILIKICGYSAVLLFTQSGFSQDMNYSGQKTYAQEVSEHNQKVYDKYKADANELSKKIQVIYNELLQLEVGFIDDCMKTMSDKVIKMKRDPENDVWYKLKLILRDIIVETWKNLNYKALDTNIPALASRIEFYNNILKQLQSLPQTSDGKNVEAYTNHLISRCSKILEYYKVMHRACKKALHDGIFTSDNSEALNNLFEEK